MKRLSSSEIVLIISFIFMISGFIYSWSKSSNLKEYAKENLKTQAEIKQIINYKKSWDQKGVRSKVDRLRFLVSSNVEFWRVSSKKATIKLKGVQIKSLNRFLVKLSSLPIQFITLDINSNGDKYSMECRCKW